MNSLIKRDRAYSDFHSNGKNYTRAIREANALRRKVFNQGTGYIGYQNDVEMRGTGLNSRISPEDVKRFVPAKFGVTITSY